MASADTPIESPENETAGEPEDQGPHRPALVYAALAAGAAVLAILLVVVWLSSRGDDGGDQPLCLDITLDSAENEVLLGNVERIDVLIDGDQPLNGLTLIQLRLGDGDCRSLPEGADSRPALYQILGVVALYNEEGENRIDVNYLRQDVPIALLQTSTPIPTETTEPTVTPTPTEEPDMASPPPSPTETATASATQTSTPPLVASPVPPASPAASPVASPVPASPSPQS